MNKKIFNLYNISIARNIIYGLAIMWIVFFHSGIEIKNETLRLVKSYGDCGVEIFFIVSGISLYFSFSKDEKLGSFYIRRFKRIIPPYLIVYTTVFFIFDIWQAHNIKQFLLDISMLDFWLHGLGRVPWFVAGIIIFYLIYPFIYKLLYKDYECKKVLLPLVLLLILLVSFNLSIKYAYLRIFFIRIPCFLLGCMLGKLVFEKKHLKCWHFLILVTILITSYLLFYYKREIWWTRNLYYIPLSIFLIFGFSLFYKLINNHFKSLGLILEFVGTISLEIYLLHEKIQENLYKLLSHINVIINFNDQLYQINCIILSIFIAFLINQIIKLFKNMKKFISNF